MTAVTEKGLTVSQLLKLAQQRTGFTIQELCNHCKVAEITAECWMSGRYMPSKKYHKAICECTRTHLTRFTRVYEQDLKARKLANINKSLEEVKGVQEKPETKEVDTQWAVELAFEVSRLDKEVYEMFISVLKNINKEKGITR